MTMILRRLSSRWLKPLCAIKTRSLSHSILAIETSFDNTAAAVVSSDGQIVSEEIFDQVKYHNMHGGTDPKFAKNLHQRHLPKIVDNCLSNADLHSLKAVAVTTMPGRSIC